MHDILYILTFMYIFFSFLILICENLQTCKLAVAKCFFSCDYVMLCYVMCPTTWLAVETMIFFVVKGSKNLTESHATITTMFADQKHRSLEVMN